MIPTSLRCCFLYYRWINCQKVYLQIVVLLQVPLKNKQKTKKKNMRNKKLVAK